MHLREIHGIISPKLAAFNAWVHEVPSVFLIDGLPVINLGHFCSLRG